LFFNCENKPKVDDKKISLEKKNQDQSPLQIPKAKVESSNQEINNDAKNESDIDVKEEEDVELHTFYFDLDSISFEGILLKSKKEKIIEILGSPDSINEPKYECGFHSEDEQGERFYQYFYGSMNFILSDSESDIERILFDDTQELLVYGFRINSETTFEEIINHFGIRNNDYPNKNTLTFLPKGGYDEQYYFIFENEKVVEFEIWTPC